MGISRVSAILTNVRGFGGLIDVDCDSNERTECERRKVGFVDRHAGSHNRQRG